MTEPAPGVGPYRVVGPLGRGGHAVVVEAVAPDGRRVAIKQLVAARPDALARFEREGRLLKELGDGFVPLLDAGSVVGPDGVERPYLVLPLLPGGSLQERLRRGPLAVDEAVALLLTVGRALARAHARGIVHRDLKPSNILFDREGRPCVADLGLGLDPTARAEERLTGSRDVSGTPGYMAPEQLVGLREAGPSADVFALGAILYEALAGQPAFEGDTAMVKLARVAQGTVTPLRDVRRAVPPWLAAVVHGCLAVDPAARPADAGLLVRALQRGAASRGAREGRRRLALGGGVAAGLAAIGLGAALLGPGPAPTAAPPTATMAPPSTATVLTGPVAPVASSARAERVSLRRRQPPLPRLEGAQVVAAWLGTPGASGLAVVEAPGGACVAAPDPGGDLLLHDLATGAVRLRLQGTGSPLVAVAASDDGQHLAAADLDERLLRWSRRAGPALAFDPAPPLTGTVSAAALTYAGEVLAVAEHDGSVWAVDPWGSVRVVAISTREGDGAAFPSPLLAASRDVVVLGDRQRPVAFVLRDPREAVKLDLAPGWPRGLTVAADGLGGLALGRFGSFMSWSAATGEVARPAVIPLDPGPPRALARSADPGRVTALVFDGGVSLLRDGSLEPLSGWSLPGVLAAAVTSAGVVAVGQTDGSVSAWEVPPGGAPARRLWFVAREPNALAAIAWARSDLVLMADAAGQVGAFDPGGAGAQSMWGGRLEGVQAGCTLDPARLLLVDGNGHLLEARASVTTLVDLHRRLPGPLAALAGRGGYLAMHAGDDLTVYDDPERPANPRDPLRMVLGLRAKGVEPPRALALLVGADTSEGLRVVVGRPDGSLDLVGPTGSERRLGRHERAITALATCAAGVVAGDAGGDVRLWPPAGDSVLLGQHPLDVQALVASPDGALVASLARDEVVAVWRPGAGKGARALVDLEPARDAPTCVAFSPDGGSLVLGTRRGRLLRVALGP